MGRKKKEDDQAKGADEPQSGDGQVVRWINTPFAYARVLAGQSKLEQDILLQVSEHIQSCLKPFYDQGRNKLVDRPNPLFVGEARAKMLEPIRITLSEYGIKHNHYDDIRNAVESILNIKWVIPISTDQGIAYSMVNVFSRGFTEYVTKGEKQLQSKGYIDFYINPDMADYAFDMSLGYVQHPRRIARESSATHTSLLYMLIKHHCGPRNKCEIPLLEIKKTLGLVVRDTATDRIVSYMMPQYNQFRKRVLDKVKADLDSMGANGKIDFSYTYREIRTGGKVKGDPAAIEFTLVPIGQCADAAPKRRGRPRKNIDNAPSLFDYGNAANEEKPKIVEGEYAEEYQELLNRCSPEYRRWLDKARHVGSQRGCFLVHFSSRRAYDDFNSFEEDKKNSRLRDEFVALCREILKLGDYGPTLIRGYDTGE